MIVVLQRVERASVEVGGEVVAQIGTGLLLLACAVVGDGDEDAEWLAEKLSTLRVFADAEGRTNLSLADVRGAALLVSQFTLAADCRKGRRPSFVRAAAPDEGRRLVERLGEGLRRRGVPLQQGRFGAAMAVHLVNDGPFTLLLDSHARAGDAGERDGSASSS